MNFHSVTMKDTCLDFWPSLKFLLEHQIKLVPRFKAGCIFLDTLYENCMDFTSVEKLRELIAFSANVYRFNLTKHGKATAFAY